MLTGSVNPPAKRILGLSAVDDAISFGDNDYKLSNFEFEGCSIDGEAVVSDSFERDLGVSFFYDFGFAKVRKTLYLDPDADRVALVYEFSDVVDGFDFTVKPLVAIRDFHSLIAGCPEYQCEVADSGLTISSPLCEEVVLKLGSDDMEYFHCPEFWYNFVYRKEAQRGQDFRENLLNTGQFSCFVDSPKQVILWAQIGASDDLLEDELLDIDTLVDSLELEQKGILKNVSTSDSRRGQLYRAASQFVVDRNINGKGTSTILAGYPWFLDWGRDTFISLSGLLLETGRFERAKEVLSTFAGAVDRGMVPNRFDDYGGQAHYNSIDASLWFVYGAFEYLRFSDDKQDFMADMLPAIRWIVDCYHDGTRFGICADSDGLIAGGDSDTQLTWMDAKCDGVAFTPRYGKAVEINSLWYNAIRMLGEFYYDKPDSGKIGQQYLHQADEIKQSFEALFWNEHKQCLYDFVADGKANDSVRPNQIFAVSLRYSLLPEDKQRQVVSVVEDELLTDYGLRSLSYKDADYKGKCQGGCFERDSAYHQGTVWSWLIGPFVKAYLKVNGNDRASKIRAMDMIKPLLGHMDNDGCLGSVSEIFDGDSPYKPRGCFAQAWSVAGLIEAYNLLNGAK